MKRGPYKRHRDTIDYDFARQAYADLKSVTKAASLCGVSRVTMTKILDEAGVVRERGNQGHCFGKIIKGRRRAR